MLKTAMTNQKGGVGKTTSTINLAAALAQRGHRVLMLDFDPQYHLTMATGVKIAPDAEVCLATVLLDTELQTQEIAESLAQPWKPGIDVIPSNIQMTMTERFIYNEPLREHRLKHLVELLEAADRWDILLIDCPPSLAILSDNALVAADQIIIPVESEDSSLHALSLLMVQIQSSKKKLRINPEIIGMIVNAYDARKGYEVTSTYEQLKAMKGLPILATIKDKAAMRRAWRSSETVFDTAPDSEEAQEYLNIAKALEGDDE